jgi:hypothetical protein
LDVPFVHAQDLPLVALDNHAFSGPGRGLKLTLGPLVGAIAVLAVLLVLGAILARGFSENGFRLGSQFAWRYASFIFFAALALGPLCRIVAHFFPAFTPPESLSRKLVWGFCAAYGVYLLSVFVPNVIHLSAGAMLMTMFGSTVVLVMAITAAPLVRLGRPPILPNKVRKVLLGTSAIYFWLCYSVMALARISGPHRPDSFYGISLSLMILGLLLRYADRWLAHRSAAPAAA